MGASHTLVEIVRYLSFEREKPMDLNSKRGFAFKEVERLVGQAVAGEISSH